MDKITQHDVGDDTILTSSATVMEIVSHGAVPRADWRGMVSFREAGWKNSKTSVRAVRIPKGVWEEMGLPDKVTMTIEPGDRLNVDEEDR